jgi:predicted nucleotidyltransferase
MSDTEKILFEIVERIRKSLEPERVILFGSRAEDRGQSLTIHNFF